MIVIFGSINMDVNMQVKAFPRAGETILSPDYEMTPGGKGANQSLAAARGDAKTALVGKVGDDGMGHRILAGLRRNEVMTSGVGTSEVLSTGLAFVMRDLSGENQIVVASGANSDVQASQVPDEILKEGNIVLLQMEVPLAQNIALMERAKKIGASVMLNLAPAIAIPRDALGNVDYLVVNEIEAGFVAGLLGVAQSDDYAALAKSIAAKAGLTCVITLGSRGAVSVDAKGEGWRVPALKVSEIVDTTGAGDCFCGTLAAALHNKIPMGDAMRRASVAATLACTKKGAQESYPYISDVEEALKNFPQAEKI